MKIFNKTTTLLYTSTMLLAYMVVFISCSGCKSGKVSYQDNQLVGNKESGNIVQSDHNIDRDTTTYFYQDVPELRDLKLTRKYKAEVYIKLPEGEEIKSKFYMFEADGRYIGEFDPAAWEKKDGINDFLIKYQNEAKEAFHVSYKKRDKIWKELQELGVKISKNEMKNVGYITGMSLMIGPATLNYSLDAYGFIGYRSLTFYGDYDKLFHETYVFDYKGKLLNIYDYSQVGESLELYNRGRNGISLYFEKGDEYQLFLHFRYHDFQSNTHIDFNPYKVNPKYRALELISPPNIYFGKEFVQFTDEGEHSTTRVIADFDKRILYYKDYNFGSETRMQEWGDLTLPDGTKEDLTQFEKFNF